MFKKCYTEELETLQKMLLVDDIETSILAAKLASLNRRICDVCGDGNCLFYSVADQINNHPTHPVNINGKQLRAAVVRYLRKYKKDFQVLVLL